MKNQNIEMNVLIKGKKAATEYRSPRNNKLYIEGRDGSEFEIEVRNNNPFRIEAVIAVDGISITDGEEAGLESRGFVVEANDAIVIPGWKLDGASAAKFQFSGHKGGSYAEAVTGSPANKGVIGIMAFEDASARFVTLNQNPSYTKLAGTTPLGNWRLFNGPLCGSAGLIVDGAVTADKISAGSITSTQLSASSAAQTATNAATWTSVAMCSANSASTHATMASSSATTSAANSLAAMEDYFFSVSDQERGSNVNSLSEVKQTLGTAFGDETEFKTTEVKFERGDMIWMGMVYYDDKRGLEKRGIQIVKPSRRRVYEEPQAFPAMQSKGCTPPPGWEPNKRTRRMK